MRTMSRLNGNRAERHPKCCVCGCTDGPLHFHHNTPARSGDVESNLWESLKDEINGSLRVFGPEDLLDMADFRRKSGTDSGSLAKGIRNLKVGDQVKLCFLVKDKNAPWLPREMLHMARACESESMLVRITAVDGEWPNTRFEGELLNMPVLIDPHTLHLGSQGRFTPEHVHSV